MDADHFISSVRAALAEAGFRPPASGEGCTIVFAGGRFPPPAVSAAAALLDAGEAGRAARFRFEQDRTRYVLAHAVWRVVLSACMEVAPVQVPLVAMPSGQPSLPGTGFSTSLSHAGEWVAVAVGRGAIIGIDIEQQPSRVRLADMVDTICTPDEAARVMALDATARERLLLALWTRKEALLKAFGVGLGVDLASFDAGADAPVAPPPAAAGLPPCRVFALDLAAGLVGAVALPAGVERVAQHVLDRTSPAFGAFAGL
jgi:4'-phosphopantetheinyl transferase